MSATDASEPATARVLSPTPPSAPEPVATPWRDRGWSDAALAALFGGSSVQEGSR